MSIRLAFRPLRATVLRNKMNFSSVPSGNQEARAARKARTPTTATAPVQGTKANSGVYGVLFGLSLLLGGIGYGVNDILRNPKGTLATAYKGSAVESTVKALYNLTLGRVGEIFEPMSDKLLPDWPTAPCYANIPPGTPCPPTLIVDLEKTLMGSVYDAKHGWRHVKRPGYDKFIKALSQYYEVVIFSENDAGMVQEIVDSIDPEGQTHRLGASAAEIRDGKVLKRLEYMNRDPRRILVIDDNPESVELCMANALLVRPFDDVNILHDRTLENLIPLLQAFVHDGSVDFQRTLADLGTHEADEAVAEYRMRLSEVKNAEKKRRNRGLGGLLRGQASAVSEDDGFGPRSAVLSPSDIVGSSAAELALNTAQIREGAVPLEKNYFHKDKPKPSDVKKKGALMAYLEKQEAQKAEEENIKRNKMNELYQQRMAAKAAAAQQEQD